MQDRVNQYISALWLSICAGFLTYALFEEKKLSFFYVCFSSFACLFIYTFPAHLMMSWNLVFSGLLLTVNAFFLWQVQPNILALTLLLILGIFSLSYVSPHLLGFQVRNIPYLKAPLVAFIWTYLTSLFPILGSELSMEPIKFCSVFLFFLALTIPFDIRDREKDATTIKTFAIVLGRRGALWVQLFMLFILSALFLYQNFSPVFVGLTTSYLFVMSVLTSSKKDFLVWTLLLDGSIVLFVFIFYFN